MKIGIVLYPTFGGSGVVATELGKELAQLDHQVHFITYSQPVRLDYFGKNIFYHEVSVLDYPLFDYLPYEINLSSKLVDVVKHEKLDLLHVHYAIPHASAAYMAKQILKKEGIDIPVITTLHGTDITLVGKDPSFEPVINFVMNESDALTAVSESLARDTYEHFKLEKKIDVIPNFIRIERYTEDKKNLRATIAQKGERVIMHISNFRPVKRVEDVVRVFAKVCEKIPSRMVFVGDGPERFKIETLCRELGVYSKCVFLGKIRSTEEVLASADLFLLTSETESFGLAGLEAMAAKVPVISTNQGGLPEVNIDGETGFLCDVGDVDAMAEKTIHILEDDEVLARFRAGAFAQANRFSIQEILPQYLNLYRRVLGWDT